MLVLYLRRTYYGETYTIGNIEYREHKICDTLEDKTRVLNSEKDKIYGKTAIPAGRYKVILTWSPHFRCYMPELENVPFFRNIRIHWGNKPEDTDGCILVGEDNHKGQIVNSRITYNRLMNILLPAFKNGEEVWIEIS